MKQKLVEFFKEKKELLLFIGLLTAVFSIVIVIANLALKDNKDTGVITPPNTDNVDPVIKPDDKKDDEEEVTYLFKAPCNDCLLVRVFFETSKSSDSLASAVISYNSTFIESKGVTYQKSDDSDFSVYSSYPGKVVESKFDETLGYVVVIDYTNDVYGIYSSLSSTSLKEGDMVEDGALIGVSGKNNYDVLASNHLSYELKVGNSYIDPELSFGKKIEDVILLKELVK